MSRFQPKRSGTRHVVKRRAALAGLEGDFGAHSLRSGFVTEAGQQNVPIAEAMGLTGHRSLVTFMRYFQTGAVQSNAAADLLRDEAKSTHIVTETGK